VQYGSEFEPPLLPGARRAPRSLALDSRYEALLVRLRSRPQWQRVPLSEQSVRQATRGRVRPCAFVSEQYAGGSCVESSSQVRPGGPNLPRASPQRRDVPRAGSHQGRKVARGEFSVLRCQTWVNVQWFCPRTTLRDSRSKPLHFVCCTSRAEHVLFLPSGWSQREAHRLRSGLTSRPRAPRCARLVCAMVPGGTALVGNRCVQSFPRRVTRDVRPSRTKPIIR